MYDIEQILYYEPFIRFGCFVLLLIVLLDLEKRRPWQANPNFWRRWRRHTGLLIIDIALLRLILPFTSIGITLFIEQKHTGLLNHIALPYWLSCVVAIVMLDCLIYWQHRLFHRIPCLWRLHIVHHTDNLLDTSSGLRFHPLEIIVSMLIKLAFMILLGVPPIAALLFEIILNSASLFTHSNIHVSAKWDKRLRYLFVTPDMHRTHHSHLSHETNSNYSFHLNIWDKLFKTYKQASDTDIYFGIEKPQAELNLWALLKLPLYMAKSNNSNNREQS